MRLLSGGTFSPSVQELHPNDRCRKRDYPVHIDSNVVAKASLRTKTVRMVAAIEQARIIHESS